MILSKFSLNFNNSERDGIDESDTINNGDSTTDSHDEDTTNFITNTPDYQNVKRNISTNAEEPEDVTAISEE